VQICHDTEVNLMRARWLMLVLALSWMSGAETREDASKLLGVWVIDAAGDDSVIEACRGMSLELTAGGRVIRTTGDLVYSSTVKVSRVRSGWQLTEVLEGHNGLPSCSGEPATDVVAHLANPVYVEIEGSVLNYFRSPQRGRPSLRFRRASNGAHALSR
jgi:hypothetical protein